MSQPDSNGKHTISVFVHDRPGVLSRVAQVFARRGYNVDSLVVSPGHDIGFSRMTIVSMGDPTVLDQIIKQLDKLVDVVRVAEHTVEESVVRELGLFKVKADVSNRTEILQIVDVFRAKTVDISEDSLIVEVTGDSEKLDAVESMLSKFGIVEMVRSGKLIIARGSELT
jgi:acetolactate synthase-1/3 small subunit